MNYLLIVFIFILGLIFGSFLNALEYRIEAKKSIKGRSFCPKCKHQLAWFDLIPVFSWIALRGKCRYCEKNISFQYPLMELLTAGTFVLAAYKSNLILNFNEFLNGASYQNLLMSKIVFILLLIISFCFLLIALHDAKTTYVLQKPVVVLFVSSVLYLGANYLFYKTSPLPYLLTGIVSYLIFYSIYFFSKGRWMGDGDAQISGLIGLVLGPTGAIVAMYIAFILGSIYGLYKVYNKKAQMNSQMAFGQFLILGFFLSLLFADKIISFYVRIFL